LTDERIRVLNPSDPDETYSIPATYAAVWCCEILGWSPASFEDARRAALIMGRTLLA
jgi:hypothetical protein